MSRVFLFVVLAAAVLLFGCCDFLQPPSGFPEPIIPQVPTEPLPPLPPVNIQTCTPGWTCKDANIRAYQTANCEWEDESICAFGCLNSMCRPDLCANMACNDKCEGTTKMYNGKCEDGRCTYSAVDCTHGCVNGVCTGDLCEGVVCANHCEGSKLFSQGQCIGGLCLYEINECVYGCENAKCKELVCDIVMEKETICVGEPVVGHMYGAPGDICDLYYSANGGDWQRDTTTPTFHLDAQGRYSETRTGASPNTYEFRANCGKCISDIGLLTVINCPQPPTGNCDETCKGQGYAGGYDGTCGKKWLYEGEVQVGDCCCYADAIPPGYRCYDTDTDPAIGSNNPTVFGTCYDEAHPNGIADYCAGPEGTDNWVGENYCSGGTCWGVSELCPPNTHCVDGACVAYTGGETDCAARAAQYNYPHWNSGLTSMQACQEYATQDCITRQQSVLGFQFENGCCMWMCSGDT